MIRLTKRKLLTAPKGGRAPFRDQRQIARLVDCHESYVSKWPMDALIPERYEFRIRMAKPRVDWDAIARQKLPTVAVAVAA